MSYIKNQGTLHRLNIHHMYAILMCVFICRETLVTYVTATLNKIPGLNLISPMVLPVTLFTLIVLSFNEERLSPIRRRDVLLPLFLILAIMLTLFIYPENEQYLWFNFQQYVALCIPAYFVGLCSVDYDESMYKTISMVACISIIASYLLLLYYNRVEVSLTGDDLGQSYAVLPSTLFVISYCYHKKSLLYGIFSALGILYSLMLGSRGPIVLILVFIGINFILKNRKRWVLIVLICLGVYAIYNFGFYKYILEYLHDTLHNMGYSTRIIDLAMKNEIISHDSGRNDIYVTLLNLLKERPLVGYGLFGEWQFTGWNAHNIYVEVVFEYGWPIGIVLIVGYVWRVLLAYFSEKNTVAQEFMLVFIVFVLVQGFRSYSHLRPELFLLLGFCVKQNRWKKRCI